MKLDRIFLSSIILGFTLAVECNTISVKADSVSSDTIEHIDVQKEQVNQTESDNIDAQKEQVNQIEGDNSTINLPNSSSENNTRNDIQLNLNLGAEKVPENKDNQNDLTNKDRFKRTDQFSSIQNYEKKKSPNMSFVALSINNNFGWRKINGQWYYFSADGTLQRDKMITDSTGSTYALDNDGNYLTNRWYNHYGDEMYIQPDGKVFRPGYESWNLLPTAFGPKWYYLSADGILQRDKMITDSTGSTYALDNDGNYLTNRWYSYYGERFYIGVDGKVQR